jgi:hypothetical protein
MGMRDIIAHHYFDLEADKIFDTLKEEIPVLLKGTSKNSVFSSLRLRGTKQEAIQNIDYKWIASGYCPRNDAGGLFLEVSSM